MANIEVMTPKTYSSYQLNTLCTVKFKINGTIGCMSEKLTPRVSYKNSSGGFSHIIIQNLRCNSNGIYDDIDEIDSSSYTNKSYEGQFMLPMNDQVEGTKLELFVELIGEEEYDEDNSDLGIRSDIILISTITKANFTTKPFNTKKIASAVKVLMETEETLSPGDFIDWIVEASNNANDETPIWKDISKEFALGEFATFDNYKAAEKPAISIRVTIKKNSWNTRLIIKEINFAFY